MSFQTQKQWTVNIGKGFGGLELDDQAPIPQPRDHEVLVKFHAGSLNYRDLIIATGDYPFHKIDGIVPGSDGAGTVEAVGKSVQRFKAGDRVVTQFDQEHIAGHIDDIAIASGLGGTINGTFRQYGTFPEYGLVKAPSNLDFVEACTLSCAAVTAWNALYGVEGRALKAGDWVVTQGTGGVSTFGVQLAKAAGARIIATTSSAEKAAILKKLGADHVLNYKEDKDWGETAKKLTGGRGVDHVIEVGGASTMRQSLKALRLEGVMSVIGFIGGDGEQPGLLEALNHAVVIRGVMIGSRHQFEDMIRCIEANDIHPVIDDKIFTIDELKEAYQYQWDQKHFGKVVVKLL